MSLVPPDNPNSPKGLGGPKKGLKSIIKSIIKSIVKDPPPHKRKPCLRKAKYLKKWSLTLPVFKETILSANHVILMASIVLIDQPVT